MTANVAELEQLWQEHHDKLVSYMARRVPSDMAEDLVQDVYLRACEAMQRGNGYSSYASGWLFRIAHNLVIDLYRMRDKTPNTIELDAPVLLGDEYYSTVGEETPCNAPMPCDLAEQAILCETMQGCINKLSDDQALVVKRHMENYTPTEIAQLIGRTSGAVTLLKIRGHEQLRKMMDREGNFICPPKLMIHAHSILEHTIKERGPLTVSLLMEYTGIRRGTIHEALAKHEKFQRMNLVGGGYLWGLQEQEAA